MSEGGAVATQHPPASSGRDLLVVLRGLADAGATVIFTTHSIQDLRVCDRVVFLARGGRLVFEGGLDAARQHFGVSSIEEIYDRLRDLDDQPDAAMSPASSDSPEVAAVPPPEPRPAPGFLAQWRVLTARTFETLARNTLTLAILRRERLVGLRLGPYLLSKVSVLLPFLVLVNVLMLVVLRALDRLPPADTSAYLSVGFTLTLGALAALTLGLLASAAVGNPSQATLALPMLCFPAVLFSGAILPGHVMATVGRWISVGVPVRWAFEAVGRDLEVRRLLLEGASPLGPPLVDTYGSAGLQNVETYWAYLAGFSILFFAAAWVVLARAAGRSSR